jgi:hypothetical protein
MGRCLPHALLPYTAIIPLFTAEQDTLCPFLLFGNQAMWCTCARKVVGLDFLALVAGPKRSLMLAENGANTLIGEDFQQQGMRNTAINDMGL